jgi:hypothetical protein
MKNYILFFTLFSLTLLSCISSKFTATEGELKALTDLVNNRNFSIESEWAYPTTSRAMQQAAQLLGPGNNANSISLVGNTNFLTISGDSITSFLPYFGERQMGGAYGGADSAIEFKGIMENYKAVKNKKDGYDISFLAKSKSEVFNVSIKLFSNLKADISLNGNTRSFIRYSGTAKSIEK